MLFILFAMHFVMKRRFFLINGQNPLTSGASDLLFSA